MEKGDQRPIPLIFFFIIQVTESELVRPNRN
jgi:hypothetical protein